MSIIASVGWFVADQKDVDIVKSFILDLGINVQLSFYERKDAEKWMWEMGECREFIHTIHLFKGMIESDFFEGNIVSELASFYEVKRFVLHPFSGDLLFIIDRVRENGWTLCLENFKRGMANPFTMLATFGEELQAEHLGICVDFSHLEGGLSTASFVKGLLPYTKVWHLSNRLGKKQHLPIHAQDTDTHAQGVLARLLVIPDFPVQEIVLEYMREYKDKLSKHYFWLNSYIMKKRRQFDGDL